MKFKRIIFNLFYEDGFFCQSRNFFLQRVGDVNWLKNTFGFENLSNYIDELIITLTTINPSVKKVKKYLNDVEIIKKNFFLPITLAGGIRSIEDVQQRFNSGADKILLNSLVHIDIEKINSISNRYGSQAVILGCDYIYMNNKIITKFQSAKRYSYEIKEYLIRLRKNKINFGELLVNSIDKDGTGQGFDLNIIKIFKDFDKPLIVMGGAGNSDHFLQVFKKNIDAAATGNLFNFLGSGLKNTRLILIKKKFKLVNFD
jgi:cyclase